MCGVYSPWTETWKWISHLSSQKYAAEREANYAVDRVKCVSPLTPYMDVVVSIPVDFYNLLPDLYGERCCTANAHLLSYLTEYVWLWGPLWTHSSFGYESKNGHIKRFIHNKLNVVKQLLFNVDVSITLQHIYPIL